MPHAVVATSAPKARDMTARGKREARRPWIASKKKALSPEKGEIDTFASR